MSNILPLTFSEGYVSARGEDDLAPGELTRALGIYWKKGDPHPWAMPGRTAFGTVLAANRIKGLALCQFDEGGNDKLVAYAGTAYYGATPGTTGTFASLVSGLNVLGEELTAVHMNDRWYLGNGYDRNKKLTPAGVVVDAGMTTPTVALTASPTLLAAIISNPTANTGGFTNPTFAYDGNTETYASGSLSVPGTITHLYADWAASATAGRQLEIRWWLAGLPIDNDTIDRTGGIGTGGVISSGYEVDLLLEKSEDSGATWTALVDSTFESPPSGIQRIMVTVTADSSLLQFRATMTYVSGTNTATFQLHNVRTRVGSQTAAFTTEFGYYYAYTEFDGSENDESPPSPLSALVTVTDQNLVILTRGAAVNTRATHWRVYRTEDGDAKSIANLRLIQTLPIAQTTALDNFELAATSTVPLLTIGDLSIPRDTQSPAFVTMFGYDASVCGLSLDFPRELRYSEAGFPESFPEFYVVSCFSLPENDRLMAGVDLGRTLVLFASGAVVSVDGLPRVVDGKFEAGKARPIAGHPGCVGRKAATKYSVSGEGRAAWVSPFGIFTTNSETCEPLSLDIDWEADVPQAYLSTAALEWDHKTLILWFHFDTDGDGANDRSVPIHMSPTHTKQNGQPKWGQPNEKETSCFANGLISATYRRYSGHPSDGVVYLEDSGYLDASTGLPLTVSVATGQLSNDRTDIGVLKITIAHSDWGDGASGTITATVGHDTTGDSESVAQPLSLEGSRSHEVAILRAGEWLQVQIDHEAAAGGRIGQGKIEVQRQGRSGSANRWASTSATP